MQGTNFSESDSMSYDGFMTCIRLDIQRRLGSRFQVKAEEVTKNNDTKLKGLIIMEQGINIHPTVYMEYFYEQYKAGMTLEEIEDNVLQTYRENRREERFNTDLFMDWQKMRKRITYKLINYESNREILKDVPYQKILDLAIVFECLLDMGDAGGGTILIRNTHMKLWGITADELYAAAFGNTPELLGYRFTSMLEVMLEIMGSGKVTLSKAEDIPDMAELEKNQPSMYVLSNRKNFHGAGTILYKNLLKEIAEKWGCDICILPSSIHEVILVPMSEAGSYEEMSQMVREVNQTQVMPEEVLSDHMYLFSRKTGKITMQEEREYE